MRERWPGSTQSRSSAASDVYKGQPYLGAGAGITKVKWGSLSNDPRCVDGGSPCAGFEPDTVSHPGEDSWRFTYALMAGVSYDRTLRLKLDVGYRYQKTASGAMFGYDADTAAAGAAQQVSVVR